MTVILETVWRCCTTDVMWADWMERSYIKKNSFWNAFVSPMNTGTWKVIANNREQTKRYLLKEIGERKITLLWMIHGWNLADLLIKHHNILMNETGELQTSVEIFQVVISKLIFYNNMCSFFPLLFILIFTL